MLAMRIDAPIYFANVIPIREAIAKYQRRTLRALTPKGIALRYIILDMSPVTDIDASAVHWLKVRRSPSDVPGQPVDELPSGCPGALPRSGMHLSCAQSMTSQYMFSFWDGTHGICSE